MAEEAKQRRVKTTGEATHRTGSLRGGVKPHKRESAPNVKQLIETYMGSVRQGSLSATFWGTTVAKNASVLQSNFGLAASDEPYLILDASGGKGTYGMLLSKTGIHFSNGRGSVSTVAWADLPKLTVGYQRNMLVVGQNGIVATDGKVLATLLQQIQSKFGK